MQLQYVSIFFQRNSVLRLFYSQYKSVHLPGEANISRVVPTSAAWMVLKHQASSLAKHSGSRYLKMGSSKAIHITTFSGRNPVFSCKHSSVTQIISP